jgi:CubicO group peptidase (beta-lactamase class C family)
MLVRHPVSVVIATTTAALVTANAISAQTARPDPSRIEHGLRALVRVAGGPDTTFDIRDRMRLYHVPGLSVAVIDDFRVVWAKGFGVKEFGKPEQVDTTTLFLAGSISKPVFATGVLALVEQGKLSLDEDVNARLRSWRLPESRFTVTEKVTLRRLLTHSAGLTIWGFPGYDPDSSIPSVPQVLDGTPPANTQAVRNDTTPGAFWRYSGGGITIAQLMATDVSGEPFPALMKRLVLAPSSMTHSTFENPPPKAFLSKTATGHERTDTPVPGGFHVYPEMAAAGLWTTAPDLARWAITLSRAYLGQARGPISRAMAAEMLKPQVTLGPPFASPDTPFWGLGVGLGGTGDSLRFSHGGRDEGFVARFTMWPAAGRGIVILTNGVNGALMTEIVRAFDAEYGTSLAPPRVEKRATPLPTDSLRSYVGRYLLTAAPDSVFLDIRQEGNTLYGLNTQTRFERPLVPQAMDSFFDRETGSEWIFERGAAAARVEALVRVVGNQRLRAPRHPPASPR